jgi:glucokinase
MAKDAIALAAAGKAPKTFELAGFDFRRYKSSVFEAAFEAGEVSVMKAVERSAFWTGLACANLTNILNPEAILLGGGLIARIGKRYREIAVASMESHLMPALARSVRVLITALEDQAVTTGAAIIAAEGS